MDTTVKMGVTFELEGKEISLEPKTEISDIKTKGLECELPQPVELGEIGNRIGQFLDIFDESGEASKAIFEGEDVKAEIKAIPVIGEVITGILDANITINEFYIKIPPQKKTPDPTLYSVGISAVWDVKSGEGKLFGGLSLKGVYLKVSNMSAATQT
jgi:hypothetical protein